MHVDACFGDFSFSATGEKKTFELGETVSQREFTIEAFGSSGRNKQSAPIASVLTILAGELILAENVCQADKVCCCCQERKPFYLKSRMCAGDSDLLLAL